MTELSVYSRRLIGLARGQDEAAPGILRRIEQSLATRIAAGIGVGAASAAVAKSAASAVFGVTAAKVGVVGTMIAVTASAGWLILRASSFAERAAGSQAEAAGRWRAELRPDIANGSETATGKPNAAQARGPSSPVAAEKVHPAASGTATAGRVKKSSTHPETSPTAAEVALTQLQDETTDLQRAQQALRSKRPAEALALLSEQDARYPGGALAQERAAARVLALCLAGRASEARTRAKQFERQWPRSPLVARVRSSCAARGSGR